MNCPRCGAALSPSDGDHGCRRRRPSIGWEIARSALVTLAVSYGIVALVELGNAASMRSTLSQVQVSDDATVRRQRLDELSHLVSAAQVTDNVFWALLVALVVALIVWTRLSAGLVRRNGGDNVRLMLRHWSLRVWSVTLMVSVAIRVIALRPARDTVGGASDILRLMQIGYVLRAVAAAFLVIGVLLVSRRIRRFVADPTRPVFRVRQTPPATGWRRQPTEEEDLWGWEPPSTLPPPRTSAPVE